MILQTVWSYLKAKFRLQSAGKFRNERVLYQICERTVQCRDESYKNLRPGVPFREGQKSCRRFIKGSMGQRTHPRLDRLQIVSVGSLRVQPTTQIHRRRNITQPKGCQRRLVACGIDTGIPLAAIIVQKHACVGDFSLACGFLNLRTLVLLCILHWLQLDLLSQSGNGGVFSL